MRFPLRLIGSAIILLGAGRMLGAQQAAPSAASLPTVELQAAAQPSCSYADCALRVEPSLRGPRLVRGTAGSAVVGLGTPRPTELARLFAGNDSASVYAARYVRDERWNQGLTFAGAILAAAGFLQPHPLNGLSAAGTGMLLTSIPFQFRAERGLSRAVWWYNAALPSAPPGRD